MQEDNRLSQALYDLMQEDDHLSLIPYYILMLISAIFGFVIYPIFLLLVYLFA